MAVRDYCRACGAPVLMLKNLSTGRLAPIDEATSADGNIEADITKGTYRVMGKAELAERRMNDESVFHKNHFATCTEAESFRRRKAHR